MEPSTRTLAPITSTNEAKASISTASSTASRTSDSPSKSPLWRLPPDVLTNLQPSYWTRRSRHGPPDGGPTGAVPPAGFVLGFGELGESPVVSGVPVNDLELPTAEYYRDKAAEIRIVARLVNSPEVARELFGLAYLCVLRRRAARYS